MGVDGAAIVGQHFYQWCSGLLPMFLHFFVFLQAGLAMLPYKVSFGNFLLAIRNLLDTRIFTLLYCCSRNVAVFFCTFFNPSRKISHVTIVLNFLYEVSDEPDKTFYFICGRIIFFYNAAKVGELFATMKQKRD
jgi:hypothetical protein